MNISNKGRGSYLYIVAIVSFLISILLFTTIPFIYKSDSPLCEEIAYTYEVNCKETNGYSVSISNNGMQGISFEMNGETSDSYFVPSQEDKRFVVRTSDSEATAIPIVFDSNDTAHYCRAQQENTNLGPI